MNRREGRPGRGSAGKIGSAYTKGGSRGTTGGGSRGTTGERRPTGRGPLKYDRSRSSQIGGKNETEGGERTRRPSFGRRGKEERYSARPSTFDRDGFSRDRRKSDYGRTGSGRGGRPVKGKYGESRQEYRTRETEVVQDSFTESDTVYQDREDRVEGRNPVMEVLRSDRPVNKIFIEKNNSDNILSRIAGMAREKAIPIQYLERKKLDMMSLTRIHQGVILDAAVHEYAEVEDILRIAAEREEDPFIVILDGITDTNNFGSIIRSAECAGAHGIIIPKRRSATLNATVAKVAAGAQEFIAIARVTNLAKTVRDLKAKGVWMTGADPDGKKAYYEGELKGPMGLIIGSEGEGISRVVKEACDYLVKIPMKGKISSLNAGVAAGLILFEIAKGRKA